MVVVPSVVLVDRNKIIIDDSNPNEMSNEKFEALKKNIERYGFLVPIITNKDYVIADGFHRWKAARDLGIDKVPVIALDVDEVDRRMLRQIMNKLHGEHNLQKDVLEFQFLEEEGDLDTLASLMGEDREYFDQVLMVDNEIDDADPTPIEKRESKYSIEEGDMYQLGEHRLLCGNATTYGDIKKIISGAKIDMVFTDPPYGMNAVSNSGVLSERYKQDIMNDNDNFTAKKAFDLASDLNAKYNIWWGANYYSSGLPDAECWIVWDKNNGLSDQMDCELAWTNIRSVVRKIRECSEKKNRVHPTQKPPSLFKWTIDRFGIVDVNHVFDPFGGSGSTLIACEQLKRKCYMMELDPHYCSVIIERWEKLTGKKAEKIQ